MKADSWFEPACDSRWASPAAAIIAIILALACAGCRSAKEQLELELRDSFRKYLLAAQNLDENALRIYAFFPDTTNYRKHVKDVLIPYLAQVQSGTIEFDPQGLVLGRFLQLRHYQYEVLDAGLIDGGNGAQMRIGVHFSYDNNLDWADFEPGTKVFIPGNPWGTAHLITIGGANLAPRDQLKYIEIAMAFRKTNLPGAWQLRTCKALENTIEYEQSMRADF